MAVTVERITKTPGICGGSACIAGHRVRVLDITVWHEQLGWSPDEIVSQIPTLSLADVHAALSYYYDHREEIQQEIRAEREMAEEIRRGLAQAKKGLARPAEEVFDDIERAIRSQRHRPIPSVTSEPHS